MNIGETKNFNYIGEIEEFIVPNTGLYLLETWGASGAQGKWGSNTKPGGKGGYSKGYKKLNSGDVLYICVGGQGNTRTGGYNGGGNGNGDANYYGGGGGGATHISFLNTLLSETSYDDFVTNGSGLIVAGGGGGCGGTGITSGNTQGGSGGGLTGGSAILDTSTVASGGTQTSGGSTDGQFGKGANANQSYSGGGGGGLFGGGRATAGNRGGGGGSAYIGGVPTIDFKGTSYSASTDNNVNSGNGRASITFIAKGFPTLYYNDTLIDSLSFNGTNVDTVYYNGTLLS